MATLLVGDVGGTNCRMATWDGADLHDIHVWSTQEVPTLEAVTRRYLELYRISPAASCVAVAGPIRDGTAVLTNNDWSGSAADLPGPSRLINDLHAAARGIDQLPSGAVLWLSDPPTDAVGENIAVMGVGTGIGMALRVGGTIVPTEGGHTDFAPTSALQDQLVTWLRQRQARVSVEQVASGPGLERLLTFCALEQPLSATTAAMLSSAPAAQVVFERADEEPACAAALALFLDIVGAEAGNLALRSLPKGGVYLAGGVLPRIPNRVADGRVRAAFEDKPPMSGLLKDIPLGLVTNPYLGLLGAVAEAERLLR